VLTNRKRPERRGKVQLINAVGFSQKMRKSLNNKRNEIAGEQIEEITRLYGDFAEGPLSKLFETTDFAYRKVTIERPLRLNFQASPERLERLKDAKPFAGLASSKKKGKEAPGEIAAGRAQQAEILAALRRLDAGKLYTNRDAFEQDLDDAVKADGVKLPAPIRKAILAALSERDESADVCLDKDGNPEPDAELRDYENVPFKEDIRAYFEREVRPHVPDAWINESVRDEKDGQIGKVGYEIPVTRHFYVYQPPRDLAAIEADVLSLEKDIMRMLAEVTR
jgi:type I restriction enzyme M protein